MSPREQPKLRLVVNNATVQPPSIEERTDEMWAEIGHRIGIAFDRFQRRSGLSQDEIAERCGLSAGNLSRYRRGSRLGPKFAAMTVLRIALGLECDPGWLLSGVGPEPKKKTDRLAK